jgi:UDP-galactopyranose mutase
LESQDPVIRKYAEFLYEKDCMPYTTKQWGIKPEKLDKTVLDRVQVRFDYTDIYFDDKYQLLPQISFTSFFEKMLNRAGIDIMLNVDALSLLAISRKEDVIRFGGKSVDIPIVYTGPLDELLKYKYGVLPYRSLFFRYKVLETESFQDAAVIAYPSVPDYTRITEYTKLPFQDGHGMTLIAYEYPAEYGSENGQHPYYPILTDESKKIHNQYLKDIYKAGKIFPCGRLADFRYYNMDQVIERAMQVFHNIELSCWK